MLEHALSYAARGWPVFPCKPRDKRPATANGCKDGTTSAGQIESWWLRMPNANIGISTGGAIFVLDADSEHAIKEMQSRGLGGATVQTSRGVHWYFHGLGFPVRNSASSIYPGVDIRGVGGYVIAPPSVYASGAQARIIGEVQHAPDWLMKELAPRPRASASPAAHKPIATGSATKYGERALSLECHAVYTCGPGARNDTLAKACYSIGGLVGGGQIAFDVALDALTDAGIGSGLPKDEVDRTVRRILKQGAESPRAPKEDSQWQKRKPPTTSRS